MTADLTHPADEVPGGPWDGAPVFARSQCRRFAWTGFMACDSMVTTRSGPLRRAGPVVHHVYDRSTLVLRLDDPIGLGLMGLAARVAARLEPGDHSCNHGGMPDPAKQGRNHFVQYLLLRGVHSGWFTNQDKPGTWLAVICWVASYLALTDRLCALVGLELQPGEVARWWKHGDGWWLMCEDGGLEFCDCSEAVAANEHHPVRPVTWVEETTDSLAALRHAVREMEGPHGR